MSITQDFEKKKFSISHVGHWSDFDVKQLLLHARTVESELEELRATQTPGSAPTSPSEYSRDQMRENEGRKP